MSDFVVRMLSSCAPLFLGLSAQLASEQVPKAYDTFRRK